MWIVWVATDAYFSCSLPNLDSFHCVVCRRASEPPAWCYHLGRVFDHRQAAVVFPAEVGALVPLTILLQPHRKEVAATPPPQPAVWTQSAPGVCTRPETERDCLEMSHLQDVRCQFHGRKRRRTLSDSSEHQAQVAMLFLALLQTLRQLHLWGFGGLIHFWRCCPCDGWHKRTDRREGRETGRLSWVFHDKIYDQRFILTDHKLHVHTQAP